MGGELEKTRCRRAIIDIWKHEWATHGTCMRLVSKPENDAESNQVL